MSLDEYRSKRGFRRTSEPPGQTAHTRRQSSFASKEHFSSSHQKKPTAKKQGTHPIQATKAVASQHEVEFTNLDKVMFSDIGITKGEVIDFYRRIAPFLLPHLRDQPVTLERLPEGVGRGPRFWQKNIPDHYPDWLQRVELPTEDGKSVRYAVVNDLPSLLFLVNQGTLTFHVWPSRLVDLDWPDYVLFDLDPGEAGFIAAVTVARQLHRELRDQVEAHVKTSGKTGLHVLVPWTTRGGYDDARAWAMEVAQRVVVALPDTATVERLKRKRKGRVYVDVIQNARGHHAVPPYVLRATPMATVSTPLAWKELTPKLDPSRFNLKSIFRRLSRHKSDPMANLVDRK